MMVKVQCRTNLDIRHHAEKWPEELPERPVVGDLIRSSTEWKVNNFSVRQLELRVCRVTWVHRSISTTFSVQDNWTLDVELTLPEHRFASMSEFNKWYDQITR